jgi:polysaccharide export outer membrane protein
MVQVAPGPVWEFGEMRRFMPLAALLVVFLGLFANLTATPAVAADEAAKAVRVIPAYRLGADDKIRVITFGEDALSGEFMIGGSGKVSLPLVGEVAAAGLTIPEFQKEVETALKDGYLKDPHVSVEVLTYRPFYILGEVQKPGEYPYSNGLTVLNAVATANGFTYRANTKKVFIKRADSTTEEEYPLTSTTPVAPGDTIRVAERFF